MHHVFVTPARRAVPRWVDAFPELVLHSSVPSQADVDPDALYWFDLNAFAKNQGVAPGEALPGDDSNRVATGAPTPELALESLRALLLTGVPVVVLSAVPSEAEAFLCLSLGARGYGHAQAAPEQFRELAATVEAGGLWMPPPLVSRIAGLAQRIDEPAVGSTADLSALTPREEQVAMLVARGLNNREIAETLSVSERTVKANLTATFDKLALRDRVQLALYVNRLPIH